MQKLLIVIVHYYNIFDTKKCISTIPKNLWKNILVVNNSKEKININNIRIINAKENLGFGGGINLGIKYGIKNKHTHFILCNNNILFKKHFFNKLLKIKTINFASPIILDECKNIWFNGGKIDKWRMSTSHEANSNDFLTGCCLIISRKLIKKIGFFDTSYFMYYEDVDYSLRVIKKGFIPEVKKKLEIIHVCKKNNSQNKLMEFYLAKNRLKILKKYGNIKQKIYEFLRIPKSLLEFLRNKNFYGLKGFLSEILKIFFLILFFLLFNNKTNAGEFIRFNENPILIPENNYEVNGVFSSSVVYFNNKFLMYYTSQNDSEMSISLAESSDLIHWEKNINNPIITANKNNLVICEKNVHNPKVIFDEADNKLKIWYVANCEPAQTGMPRYWIKYAESTDGISWNILDSPVLSPSVSWEAEGISGQTIWKENGEYNMIYAARNSSGKWQFGKANSTNGITWSKYLQNPILTADESYEGYNIGSPDLIIDNQYNLYYYGASLWPPQNINFATSIDSLNWEKAQNNPILELESNETGIGMPNVLKINGNTYLFFSSLVNNKWQINLASKQEITLPTTTPTPTQSLLPSQIPTPTTILPTQIPASSESKIIFIPGLFGCWNKEAILHNKSSNYKDWKINPIIKEYNAIISNFKNIGLEENKDFYIFCYDWRKKIEDSAKDLSDFVSENSFSKIKIVAHSLGGLVARSFYKDYDFGRSEKIITIGTPHMGTSKVYKLVEAGEVDQENNFQWLGEKMILVLNKDLFSSEKEVVNKIFPVAQNLLPVYSYLLKSNNTFTEQSDLVISNNYLNQLNSINLPSNNKFISYIGEKTSTDFGFKIIEPTSLDKLMGIYPDGRPIETIRQFGDYIVIKQSANYFDNKRTFPYDHGEIIYKKDSIKNIFSDLDLNFNETNLIDGEGTKINGSLLFLIRSPIDLEVTYKNNKYVSNDGILFIENAQDGEYSLKTISNDFGDYEIIYGKIFEDVSEWESIKGSVYQNPPQNQSDYYFINYLASSTSSSIVLTPSTTSIITLTVTPTQIPTTTINSCDKKILTSPKIEKIITANSSATIFWSILDNNFDYYTVSYGKSPGIMEYGIAKIEDKNLRFTTISKLQNNTTYYFRIKVGDKCNTSEFSNEVSAVINNYENTYLSKNDPDIFNNLIISVKPEEKVLGENIVNIKTQKNKEKFSNKKYYIVIFLVLVFAFIYLKLRKRKRKENFV